MKEPELAGAQVAKSSAAERDELCIPLLDAEAAEAGGLLWRGRPVPAHELGVPGSVLNLLKCVIGAGLLSIPKAFSLLGSLGASAVLVAVAYLTIFTINHGQVEPSVDPVTGALWATSYSAMVGHYLGRRMQWALSLIIMVGSLGFQAAYFDIMVDVLVGSERNPGILTAPIAHLCSCNPFPGPSGGPSPLTPAVLHAAADDRAPWAWLLRREVVLLCLVVGIVVPLGLRRSMRALGWVSVMGAVSMVTLLVSLAWLSAAAISKGVAYPPRWEPDWDQLAGGSTRSRRALLEDAAEPAAITSTVQHLWDTFVAPQPCDPDSPDDSSNSSMGRTFRQAASMLSVFSVLLTAMACQPNTHPLMAEVKPFTKGRIRTIVIITITISAVFYGIVAMASWTVFGPAIEGDVLNNMSVAFLTELVGRPSAVGMAYVVRLGYLVSVLGSSVLGLFPLRQAVADLVLKGCHVTKERLHLPITLGLLAAAYAIAVGVPSIWVVISLFGAISATVACFCVPAAVVLAQHAASKWDLGKGLLKACAVLVFALGLLVFANGMLTLYLA